MTRCSSKLNTALSASSYPLRVAAELESRELLGANEIAVMQKLVGDYDKASILTTSVKRLIKSNPRVFHDFLDILKELGDAMTHAGGIIDILRTAYEKGILT